MYPNPAISVARSLVALTMVSLIAFASNDLDPTITGLVTTAGEVQDIASRGTRVYLASGSAGLEIFDQANPGAPRQVARLSTDFDCARVAVSDSYACVVDSFSKLHLLDIRSPGNPRVLSSLPSFLGRDVSWSGDYLVAAIHGGCAVMRVTDAGTLEILGSYDANEGREDVVSSIELISVEGNHAYLGDSYWGGIRVIDISNPRLPRWVGECQTSGTPKGIISLGQHLFVAADFGGLDVIDVSDATRPRRVATFDTTRSAKSVTLLNGLAVVAEDAGFVEVLDVSNPVSPRRAGSFRASNPVRAIDVVGGMAWIAEDGRTVELVNLASLARLRRVAACPTDGTVWSFGVNGTNILMSVGSRLQAIDITGTQECRPGGSRSATTGAFPGRSTIANERAYWLVPYEDHAYGNFQILDLANTAQLPKVGHYQIDDFPTDISVSGHYAYVTGFDSGLNVLDVRDSTQIVRVSGLALAGQSTRLRLVGQRAYVSAGEAGVHILDVRDPLSPQLLGSIPTEGLATDIDVEGNLALITEAGVGLRMVDVTDPTSPRRVGLYRTKAALQRVLAIDQHAYLAAYESGLQVIDYGEPEHPRKIGGNSSIWATDLAVADGHLLVAGNHSLEIMELLDSLQIEGLLGLTGGWSLAIRGARQEGLRLQRSNNLENWHDWRELPGGTGPIVVEDLEAGEMSGAFYRIVKP